MATALRMAGIRKVFPGVVANDGADLQLERGEIHALLGQNGAGKSTLLNILCGVYRPDAGEVRVHGRRVHIASPRDAHRLGIAAVRQQVTLAPNLTVCENVLLRRTGWLFRPAVEARQVADLARRFELDVPPHARVASLTPALQQRVELLKALWARAGILALDEPTAVLTPPEVQALSRTLRRLAHEGCAIIFVTHKIEEALSLCHRVSVLRAGRTVLTAEASRLSAQDLVRAMLGDAAHAGALPRGEPGAEVVLRVEGLVVHGERRPRVVDGVWLEVRRGEVFCVLGVGGSGEEEMFQALSGLRRPAEGRILLEGEDVTRAGPRGLLRLGTAVIPAGPTGLIGSMTCGENLLLKDFWRPPYSRFGLLRPGLMRLRARELMAAYGVEPVAPGLPVSTLSGGNRRRLVLARELGRESRLLLAGHPTRGLDVRSAARVREIILQRARSGAAVLWVTSEPEEALAVAHRIAVMFDGRLREPVSPAETDVAALGMMMSGAA